MLVQMACPTALTVAEIEEVTWNDPGLQKAKKALGARLWQRFLDGAKTRRRNEQRGRCYGGWLPAELCVEEAQVKRQITNEKAIWRRHSLSPDLCVGDRVLKKDRHPGWKFRTPYEPKMWYVAKVDGTMVIVQRAGLTVVCTVLWFKMVVLVDNIQGECLTEWENPRGKPLGGCDRGRGKLYTSLMSQVIQA
ncbi:hypothetical protein NDU88_005191 [Pleurodeles waltl]|uniref:Uncharacterized protein n=1 Tax=Pleurodeles waltl TaxID=8319 RepID=A0AAV7L1M6_PLEWA|nr:hypothetical protein NDU88_005191 [Pleurodeles waltl]